MVESSNLSFDLDSFLDNISVSSRDGDHRYQRVSKNIKLAKEMVSKASLVGKVRYMNKWKLIDTENELDKLTKDHAKLIEEHIALQQKYQQMEAEFLMKKDDSKTELQLEGLKQHCAQLQVLVKELEAKLEASAIEKELVSECKTDTTKIKLIKHVVLFAKLAAERGKLTTTQKNLLRKYSKQIGETVDDIDVRDIEMPMSCESADTGISSSHNSDDEKICSPEIQLSQSGVYIEDPSSEYLCPTKKENESLELDTETFSPTPKRKRLPSIMESPIKATNSLPRISPRKKHMATSPHKLWLEMIKSPKKDASKNKISNRKRDIATSPIKRLFQDCVVSPVKKCNAATSPMAMKRKNSLSENQRKNSVDELDVEIQNILKEMTSVNFEQLSPIPPTPIDVQMEHEITTIKRKKIRQAKIFNITGEVRKLKIQNLKLTKELRWQRKQILNANKMLLNSQKTSATSTRFRGFAKKRFELTRKNKTIKKKDLVKKSPEKKQKSMLSEIENVTSSVCQPEQEYSTSKLESYSDCDTDVSRTPSEHSIDEIENHSTPTSTPNKDTSRRSQTNASKAKVIELFGEEDEEEFSEITSTFKRVLRPRANTRNSISEESKEPKRVRSVSECSNKQFIKYPIVSIFDIFDAAKRRRGSKEIERDKNMNCSDNRRKTELISNNEENLLGIKSPSCEITQISKVNCNSAETLVDTSPSNLHERVLRKRKISIVEDVNKEQGKKGKYTEIENDSSSYSCINRPMRQLRSAMTLKIDAKSENVVLSSHKEDISNKIDVIQNVISKNANGKLRDTASVKQNLKSSICLNKENSENKDCGHDISKFLERKHRIAPIATSRRTRNSSLQENRIESEKSFTHNSNKLTHELLENRSEIEKSFTGSSDKLKHELLLENRSDIESESTRKSIIQLTIESMDTDKAEILEGETNNITTDTDLGSPKESANKEKQSVKASSIRKLDLDMYPLNVPVGRHRIQHHKKENNEIEIQPKYDNKFCNVDVKASGCTIKTRKSVEVVKEKLLTSDKGLKLYKISEEKATNQNILKQNLMTADDKDFDFNQNMSAIGADKLRNKKKAIETFKTTVHTDEKDTASDEQLSTLIVRKTASDVNDDQNNFFKNMLSRYGRLIKRKTAPTSFPEDAVKTIENMLENHLGSILEVPSSKELDSFINQLESKSPKVFVAALITFLMSENRSRDILCKKMAVRIPPMTKQEQALLYVISELSKKWPECSLFDMILKCVEYKMLRLNFSPTVTQVENLSRFYAVMCRFLHMKDKLRMFMMEALYCLNYKAIPVIKQCLDAWMHVLPLSHLAQARSPIVTVLVYVIFYFRIDNDKSGLTVDGLKKILSNKYMFNMNDVSEKDILQKLKNHVIELRENSYEKRVLSVAFLVLAKRKGVKWCQKNIVEGTLMPLINDVSKKENIRAFCVSMLGSLLKPYPDHMNLHCEMTMNKLLVMMEENPSPVMEQAILFSLLLLRNHNITRVIKILTNWKPRGEVSTELKEQIKIVIQEHPLKQWLSNIKKGAVETNALYVRT